MVLLAYRPEGWFLGFFTLLFITVARSPKKEVVCSSGGRQGAPRCAKDRVFRDDGTLQLPGWGACSSCRKKRFQEKCGVLQW